MIISACPNCFEEFERRGSSKGRQPFCPPCKEESMRRKREKDKESRKAKQKDEYGKAFSSIANRVGKGFTQDMQPACANSATPDIWFADEPARTAEDTSFKQRQAMAAIQICNTCPMQKQCLNYAMTDGDAILYGIWGGTFAYERLGKTSFSGKSNPYTYQHRIRKKLRQEGYECPPIPNQKQAKTARSSIEKRRAKVVELLRLNYSTSEIAESLNVSLVTINNDVYHLRLRSGQSSS